jgi:hypothetical protein
MLLNLRSQKSTCPLQGWRFSVVRRRSYEVVNAVADGAMPDVKVPVIVMSVFEDVEIAVAFGAPIKLRVTKVMPES